MARRFVLLLLALCLSAGLRASPQPLPDPLTLDYALAQVGTGHPEVERARAAVERANAVRRAGTAADDWTVSLNTRARWIGPSELAFDRDHDDHKVSLNADTLLYDFGRGSAREAAASAEVQQFQWELVDRVSEQRLRVMQRFFDALIADLEFVARNEAMTMTFLRFDRLRERSAFGQVSDIELLEAEAAYERFLAERTAAEQRQRLAREALAQTMHRPGELSANLAEPELVDWDRDLPAYEQLLETATASNPRLLSLRERLSASAQALSSARASVRPTLHAGAEVAAYSRDESGNDEWRLGVNLNVPLYTGERGEASIAEALAGRRLARAELYRFEAQLRHALLAVWQRITLLRLRRRETLVNEDYRDLYLDRSRALYERSVRSDLGDAMAEFSAARVETARVAYSHTLAWERLHALLGTHNEVIRQVVSRDPGGGD